MVATTSILGDIVSAITGDRARVEVLIPTGVDPHEHQPSPREAARLRDARLIVANGLGLEAALQPLVDAARREGTAVVELGATVDTLPLGAHGDRAGHEARDRGARDPHFWTDPRRMVVAVDTLAVHLEALEPGLAAGAAAYVDRLRAVDEAIASQLAAIPEASRLLVTNHEALSYFADRYGFRIVGVVIPGGSTGAEPAPAALDALASTIRSLDVSAVFTDASSSPKVAAVVASEAGPGIRLVTLNTESLGAKGAPPATYLALIEELGTKIAAALGG